MVQLIRGITTDLFLTITAIQSVSTNVLWPQYIPKRLYSFVLHAYELKWHHVIIHRALAASTLLQNLSLLMEMFQPKGFPEADLWGQTLILNERAWLLQCSLYFVGLKSQVSEILLRQTRTIHGPCFLQRCRLMLEKAKVIQKNKTWEQRIEQNLLEHKILLWPKLWGQVQLLKTTLTMMPLHERHPWQNAVRQTQLSQQSLWVIHVHCCKVLHTIVALHLVIKSLGSAALL